MKTTFYSLALAWCLGGTAKGQWINSIHHVPVLPSTSDTIRFYVDLSFPSGSCDQHTQGVAVSGNLVDAYALHCLGALTVICNYTDTFVVDPLPAGNYQFRMQVDNGGLPFPCTPGIVAGPSDSVSFTVSPVTGTALYHPASGLSISTSTILDRLYVKNPNRLSAHIEVFAVSGAVVLSHSLAGEADEIPVGRLQDGFYFLKVVFEDRAMRPVTHRFAITR